MVKVLHLFTKFPWCINISKVFVFLSVIISIRIIVKVNLNFRKRCDMSDIPIRKTSNNAKIGKFEQLSDYQKLKNEYEKFLKQAEKSDMANSLTMYQKQLEMLKKLRETALKDSCYADLDIIDDEIEFLTHVTTNQTKKMAQQLDNTASAMVQVQNHKQNDLVSLFNACKNTKGEVDNETRRIVLAFKDSDVSPLIISKIVDKCRGVGEIISEEAVKSVEKMCEAKIAPDVVLQSIDESPVLQDSEVGKIDFFWVDDMLVYKSIGLSDLDSLKFSKALNKEYENKDDVFSSVVKLLGAGFDTKMTTKLISLCSSRASELGKSTLQTQSINSLITMKKNLLSTRTCERDERQNPINKLGEVIFQYDDTVLVLKNDKVIDVIEQGEDSVHRVRKEYDEVASEIENNLVLDFVKKYKTKDGEIDKNALRIFSVLRNSGITYENLLPLTEECLEKSEDNGYAINTDKVNAIMMLKKAGALSEDLLEILNSIEKDDVGKYNKKYLSNACDLTQFTIAGKEVVELLSYVVDDNKVKSFVGDFSKILERKEHILPLINLIKSSGEYDDNASEILYNLAENFLNAENSKMKEFEFVPYAEKVLSSSKSVGGKDVDENCTNVCIAMCRNNESADNILKALEICRDEYGYPKESLADIIWDMCKQQSNFENIEKLINICKPISGILDENRASVISDLLDNGCSVDEVISFAQGLGRN